VARWMASGRSLPEVAAGQAQLARDEHVRPFIDSFFEWVQLARLEQKGRNLATRAHRFCSLTIPPAALNFAR
jgi:hypothetical protein